MSDAVCVVMAGATGAVGARALHHLLADDQRVKRVTSLVRRPSPLGHGRLVSAVVDFRSPSAISLAVPEDASVAICCLGTTMKVAGSKEAFRAVDFDAVVNFARSARDRGASRFILVSSAGAKASSANFYLRTKGEAEDAVSTLDFATVCLLRPSILDDEGARHGSRPAEAVGLTVMRGIARLIGTTHRWAPISVDTVGRAIARLAVGAPSSPRVQVFESDAIHGLAKG